MNAMVRIGEGVYGWLDERLGITGILKVTALHAVPRSVNWWYVFGSALVNIFIIQVVTGMFLAMVYIPSPDHAYQSLQLISHHQLLGNVLRGIHYWGASAMVLLIFIHMSAHFLTGSYKYPRELHWLTGSMLLILTIVMAFTGQLLRWNQDAYWAIVVGAEQAARTPFIGQWVAQLLMGGPNVGGETLSRFYAIHIWLVPAGIVTFITVHIYLVIYKGISEWPVPGKPVDPKTYWAEYQTILHEDGEPFFPNALWKDALFTVLVVTLVIVLAIVLGGQALGPQANPLVPANPKPDWYLIWYFAILAMVPPSSTPYVIILAPAVGFGLLFLFPLANKGERHPARRPWAVATVILAGFATATLVWVGYQEPWKPLLIGSQATVPTLKASSYRGLTPTQVLGAHLMSGEACLACHQIDNVGGHRGPDLTAVGDRLGPDQLTWRILRGGGGMPAFGNTLTPKKLTALVSYLETRKTAGGQTQAASGP
ncbi:MAG TPA: cytochrome b N-terminal domain-containing protein [Chloroflexota bacterium]